MSMHHLRVNAIQAGHVQNPLSNSFKILFRWGIPISVLLSQISTYIDMEINVKNVVNRHVNEKIGHLKQVGF